MDEMGHNLVSYGNLHAVRMNVRAWRVSEAVSGKMRTTSMKLNETGELTSHPPHQYLTQQITRPTGMLCVTKIPQPLHLPHEEHASPSRRAVCW